MHNYGDVVEFPDAIYGISCKNGCGSMYYCVNAGIGVS